MFNYRPDWLPKEESIVAYNASSQGNTCYKTQGPDGTLYIWRYMRPKRARYKRWVKTHAIKRSAVYV